MALLILLKHIWAVKNKYYLLSKGAGTMLALLIQGEQNKLLRRCLFAGLI
jgi:hypothetical protein